MEQWERDIRNGMRLIREGCLQQGEWAKCNGCPFEEYCEAVQERSGDVFNTPDKWVVEL